MENQQPVTRTHGAARMSHTHTMPERRAPRLSCIIHAHASAWCPSCACCARLAHAKRSPVVPEPSCKCTREADATCNLCAVDQLARSTAGAEHGRTLPATHARSRSANTDGIRFSHASDGAPGKARAAVGGITCRGRPPPQPARRLWTPSSRANSVAASRPFGRPRSCR